jgi:hypothetical protein
MKRLTTLLILSLGLAACGTDDDNGGGGGGVEIVDTPLAGTVGGAPWTFVTGDTDAFLSEGEPDYFTSLYASTFTPCGFSPTSENHLIVQLPMAPGEYAFSLSGNNMTFAIAPSDNLVTFNGKIVIDEVTATTVTGGLYGRYNSANEVNGRFTATICPPTNTR